MKLVFFVILLINFSLCFYGKTFAEETVRDRMLKYHIKKMEDYDSLETYLYGLSICEVYSFTEFGQFGMLDENYRETIGLNADTVDRVCKFNFTRTSKDKKTALVPDVKNESNIYYDICPFDNTLSSNMKDIAELVSSSQFKILTFNEITEAANRVFANKSKLDPKFGGCYLVSSTHSKNTLEVVYIEKKDEQAIIKSLGSSEHKLSEDEMAMVEQGEFTIDEMKELKGIKKATGIFENATWLKDDIGGWFGNLATIVSKGTKCYDEAFTYKFFLMSLEKKKLLKHFHSLDFTAGRANFRVDFHAAALIENKRTKELYVVDSWLESGGEEARVFRYKDWIKKRHNDVIINKIKWKPIFMVCNYASSN